MTTTLRRDNRGRFISTKVQTNRIALLVDTSSSMTMFSEQLSQLVDEQLKSYVNAPKGQKNIISVYVFSTKVNRILKDFDYSVGYAPSVTFSIYGYTAMYDAIMAAIEDFEPYQNDPNTSMLIMGLTDGEENHSRLGETTTRRGIENLNKTDRFSISFLVPMGYGSRLSSRLGIPQGNIKEWNTADRRGVENCKVEINTATRNYMAARSSGAMSCNTLYVDADHLNQKTLNIMLGNRNADFAVWNVGSAEGRMPKAKSGGMQIADFINLKLSRPTNRRGIRGTQYERTEGRAFYELTKSESIQHHKAIAVMTPDGSIFTGADARKLIGLPDTNYGEVRVRPGQLGGNRLFVSSTSANRILVANTSVLYRKF